MGPANGMAAPNKIDVSETLALPAASRVDCAAEASNASNESMTTADTKRSRVDEVDAEPRQVNARATEIPRITSHARFIFQQSTASADHHSANAAQCGQQRQLSGSHLIVMADIELPPPDNAVSIAKSVA
jgi:hypothetical protein